MLVFINYNNLDMFIEIKNLSFDKSTRLRTFFTIISRLTIRKTKPIELLILISVLLRGILLKKKT